MKYKVAGLTLALVAAVLGAAPAASAQEAEASQTELCWGQEVTIGADGNGPIEGTEGDDVIMGTDGDDIIVAGAGNDIVCGLGGDDTILGGPGNDNLNGDDGNDDIRAGNGDDIVRGGGGNDALRGGNGQDTMLGAAGDDSVAGGLGPDLVRGGDGVDTVFGGGGSDLVEGGAGDDVVAGGGGNDIVRGGPGNDELIGGRGKSDSINGSGGTDTCRDRGSDSNLLGCEPDFELNVLHINDQHSHLQSDSGDLELAGEETRVQLGGFPSVVTKIAELEAEAANPVKVHAGDAVTGTLFFSLFEGEADAALMNEVCFDVFALGNHEFDSSDQGLADFLGFLNSDPECDTATVAANVVPAVGTPLNPDGQILFDENVVIDYADGQQVGYVGIDIAGKTQNSSSPLDTTQFLDEVETAQAQVDALTAAGVNKIVLVTHIGLGNDLDLASQVTGVDVIVGGDSHTLLGDVRDLGLNTGGRYPQRTADAAGNPVCVVQAWQFSWVVGELNVNFDEDGVITSCEGQPHILLADSFERRPAEDADREELTGEARDEVVAFVEATPELSIVTPDPDAQATLDSFSGQVEELQQQVIGAATEDLCLERIPGQGRSQICDVSETAVNGGDIQQLVSDAFLARSFEADIAIQNSGGVRIDIPEGDITIADVFELLPFANTIVNLEMTGAEIESVLEDAIANTLDGSTGAYPYGSGIRWDVDMTQPFGERFSNIEVLVDGAFVPLDPEATFTVATNSFVASGGDGYFTFEAVADDGRVEDTLLEYAQIFIDYLEQDLEGTISKPTEYSTQSIVAVIPE